MTIGSLRSERLETIDEYIASFPPDVRATLEEVRRAFHESAPDAQEAITYGMPTFRLNGNLVPFVGYKHHVSFFLGSPSAIEVFKKELSQYKQSKGAIQFPLGRLILLELVKRIVRFRVKENDARGRSKAQA